MSLVLREQFAGAIAAPAPGTDTVKFDEASNTFYIEDVALLGSVSANTNSRGMPRRYLQSAMEDMARIADGAKVYINHVVPKDDKEVVTRDIRDFVGRVSGTYLDGEIVKAKRLTIVNQSHLGLISDLATKDPKSFGMSPHAIGEENQDGDVVRIVSVRSVDVVAEPATTRGLFESKGNSVDIPWDQITVEDLQKNRPDLAKGLLRQFSEQIKTACESLQTLAGDMGGEDGAAGDGSAASGDGATGASGDGATGASGDKPKAEASVVTAKQEATFLRLIASSGLTLQESQVDAAVALGLTKGEAAVKQYIEDIRSTSAKPSVTRGPSLRGTTAPAKDWDVKALLQ